MPGTLTHSPADIVQQLLIDSAHGSDPVDEAAWPVFSCNEPPGPDNCITVYNTMGMGYGFSMPDNEKQEHHGISVRVRATDPGTGYAKARAIAVAFDSEFYRTGVVLDATSYCVHSLNRTSDVFALGKEVPTSRRSLFTVNAITHLIAV